MTAMGDAWSAAEVLPVWPRPRHATKGFSAAAVINDEHLFEHVSGCCTDLLREAFIRARARIWPNATASADSEPLPHTRIRVSGLREDGKPAERKSCGDASAPLFRSLRVEVLSPSPTPLAYGADESYSLDLTASGGTLRAPTEWGTLRGLETFASLVQYDGSGPLRLCALPISIRDAPDYGWRGLLLDTSRHFLPVRSGLLPMLDAMEALKLNVLHWHLVDAHGFPFGSAVAPELPSKGAVHPRLVYSVEEMRGVVAAAFARGIRVVPELDMPAHTASWAHGAPPGVVVTCRDRVARDDEGMEHGANFMALHPLKEETYRLVESLLTELAAIFPDPVIHLGGDEVDGECWLSDQLIVEWASKRQKASPGTDWKVALHGLFTARVRRMAQRLGKQIVLWDDALDAVAAAHATGEDADDGASASAGAGADASRSKAVIIDVWRDWVRTSVERREQALASGHDVVWSSLSWYLNLPQNTWDTMYAVSLPRPKSTAKAKGSIDSSRSIGTILGGEASSWGEHADQTNLQQRVLISAAAVAERLWSGKPSAIDVARQRLAALRCRLLRRGLRAPPVIPDACGEVVLAADSGLPTPERALSCVSDKQAAGAAAAAGPPAAGPSDDIAAWALALSVSGGMNVLLIAAVVLLLCGRATMKDEARRRAKKKSD